MINVGDVIKSYDFPGMTDCYLIGKVIDVTEHTITAKIIKAVSENKEYDIGSATFKTSVQGSGLLDDRFERIVVIG